MNPRRKSRPSPCIRRSSELPVPRTTDTYGADAYERCFLLTHAHLDHISSLVMSAGSMGGDSKCIYGSPQTLKDLETIFSGRIWPKLAGYDEDNPLCRLVYQA